MKVMLSNGKLVDSDLYILVKIICGSISKVLENKNI